MLEDLVTRFLHVCTLCRCHSCHHCDVRCSVLRTPGPRYISLLRLLRLGRVYRLYTWVQLMTYNQTFSLLAVTLVRNFAVREQQRQRSRSSKASPVMLAASILRIARSDRH